MSFDRELWLDTTLTLTKMSIDDEVNDDNSNVDSDDDSSDDDFSDDISDDDISNEWNKYQVSKVQCHRSTPTERTVSTLTNAGDEKLTFESTQPSVAIIHYHSSRTRTFIWF